MSAFLVKNETISKIANTIVNFSHNNTLDTPGFNHFPEDQDKQELAQAIYELNQLALKERYGQEGKVDFNYKQKEFNRTNESIAQFYNSLSCLEYQCSEGRAMEEDLYKKLKKAKKQLAYFIASKWADKHEAKWE